MQPEIIAAILGGVFALLAAIVPIIIKKFQGVKVGPGNDREASEGLSAAIGIVQKADEVLMVQRRNRYRDLSWQFPAGVVKPGENPQDKIESEVADETGIRCKVKRFLGARVHEDTRVMCYYFYCAYLDGEAENRDKKENSQVAWVRANDVHEYITSNLFHEVEKLLDDIKQKATPVKVVLGAVIFDEKVLLVQKIDDNSQLPWQLPGGTIEENESEKDAIIREVLEETGISCIPTKKLGERLHPDSKQLIVYWLCKYMGGQAIIKETDKFSGVMWITREDAITLLGNSLFEPVKAAILSIAK